MCSLSCFILKLPPLVLDRSGYSLPWPTAFRFKMFMNDRSFPRPCDEPRHYLRSTTEYEDDAGNQEYAEDKDERLGRVAHSKELISIDLPVKCIRLERAICSVSRFGTPGTEGPCSQVRCSATSRIRKAVNRDCLI